MPRTVVARVENTDACWYIGSGRCLEDLAAGSSNAAPVLGRLGVCGMLMFQTLTDIRTSSVQNHHAQWLSQANDACSLKRRKSLCLSFCDRINSPCSLQVEQISESLCSIFVCPYFVSQLFVS